MAEALGERSVVPGRYYIGHPVLDEILQIEYGSTILVLDETFSEARNLLDSLFANYGRPSPRPPVQLIAHGIPDTQRLIFAIGNMSLSDLSIKVNELRRKFRGQTLIHQYLPDVIIRDKPEDVLRVIENWQRHVGENGTVEFFLLPRGTFQDVEKKLLAIMDGALEIRIAQDAKKFRLVLSPVRCCRPQWHLHNFPYVLENGKVLIWWEGEYTDQLRGISREEVLQKLSYLKENLASLKVVAGPKNPAGELSAYDYWLLSQLKDRDLYSVFTLFPENFEALLERIARWVIEGVLDVVKLASPLRPESHAARKGMSFATRLSLRLPDSLLSRVFRFRTGSIRMIPVDTHFASKKAAMAMFTLLMEKEGMKRTESLERDLIEMEKRFSDVIGRLTAHQHLLRMGENPLARVDPKYIPKILRMTIRNGWRTGAEVKQKGEREYQVSVENCYLCADMHTNWPVCSGLEGTMEGIIGIVFKLRSVAEEFECKAVGDDKCVFRLKIE